AIGGEYDDSKGYFVSPTVIEVSDPHHSLMKTELFGPILSVYVYEDADFDEVLELCDETAEYALTGAIFATDRAAVRQATDALRSAAGNFYVNDKPTGAVVGQQPFGGSRASGGGIRSWVRALSLGPLLSVGASWEAGAVVPLEHGRGPVAAAASR
ncbi:MAG: aldehyde dehydrogenase family protein, partial [Planctomycetota bacterium]